MQTATIPSCPVCPVELSRLSCGHSVHYVEVQVGASRMSRDSPPDRSWDTSEAYRPPNSFMCSLSIGISFSLMSHYVVIPSLRYEFSVGSECTKIARFSAAAAAIFTAPQKIAGFFEDPRCAISSAKKIASEPRFLLRIKWVKMALAAEFPAIPSSAAKIASERRCAILVHSEWVSAAPKRGHNPFWYFRVDRHMRTRAPWTEVRSVQMTEEPPKSNLRLGKYRFAPVQPHVAPVRPAFCSYVCKDLLRPLQSILDHIS